MSDFVFATCAVGMEAALKLDVARARRELRFAYSRPGLVTFKAGSAIAPDDVPATPFARVWGRSLGPARDPDDAAHQLAYLGVQRVHVFARDPEHAVDPAPWHAAIRMPRGEADDGELVADIILAPNEPAWLGLHRADAHHLPHPGGAIPIEVPADAPSRAYATIEEAIAWARLPVERGQVAVEIGAAPGGAAYALARRGLDVWAVDPDDLAEHVLALPNVHHLAVEIGALRRDQLPPKVDWLVVDMNLAPQGALREIARIVPAMRASLRGAVITLELDGLGIVEELPKLRERIIAMGLRDVRMRHLPSNRLCAVALR